MDNPILPGITVVGYIEHLSQKAELRQRNLNILRSNEERFSAQDSFALAKIMDTAPRIIDRRSGLIVVYAGLVLDVARIPNRKSGDGAYVVASDTEEIGGEWFTLDGAIAWRNEILKKIAKHKIP